MISSCGANDLCCGRDFNSPLMVYVNPNFQGCYIPRIPGYAQNPIDNAREAAFTQCFSTPAIVKPTDRVVTYKKNDVPVPTVTRTNSYVATVTPSPAAPVTDQWVNYGCLPDITALDGAQPGDLGGDPLSVTACTKACGQITGATFAGLRVPSNGGTPVCTCGTGVPGYDSSQVRNMDFCREPCPDATANQNCGPQNGLLVYAKGGGGSGNLWAVDYSKRWGAAKTVRYSCQESACKSIEPPCG